MVTDEMQLVVVSRFQDGPQAEGCVFAEACLLGRRRQPSQNQNAWNGDVQNAMSQVGSDDEEDELEDDGKEVIPDVQPRWPKSDAWVACLVAAGAQGCWCAGSEARYLLSR